MYEVLSIGEALVDFIPLKETTREEVVLNAEKMLSGERVDPSLFEENVGGSPANVVCALAKLGVKTGFIGKVGNGRYGQRVKEVLDQSGVDTTHMIMAEGLATPRALVYKTENGKQFYFYRNENTADTQLVEEDIDDAVFEECKVFNFSSFSLSAEPSRSTVLNAVVKAKESGARITFDPNIRLNLWESPEQAREVIMQAIPLADILKISQSDFDFLFPGMDQREACEALYIENGTEMVIITKGDKGCYAYVNQDSYMSNTYQVDAVDTTGSGDAFLAGVIYNLMKLNKSVHDMSAVEITIMLDFANALGSLVCTRPGAIAAFPTPKEIVHCMQHIPKVMNETDNMSIWQ